LVIILKLSFDVLTSKSLR